ncbi:CG5768, partial [Drosophila busckii]
ELQATQPQAALQNVTLPLSPRKLSRGKRFVAFPLGSSASAALCLTTGVVGNPHLLYLSFGLNWGIAYDLPNITWVLHNAHGWNIKRPFSALAKIKRRHRRDLYGNLETMMDSYGLNWGVAYDLPNATWVLDSLHGFRNRPVSKAWRHRRNKRAIYKNIEFIIDNMGYNGRDCILRTLCESRQYFQSTKMNMIGEMLRTIFTLPKQRIFTRELDEHADIVHYDNAYRHAHNFDCAQQYDCHFSLIELAFGKYSKPPANYYAA